MPLKGVRYRVVTKGGKKIRLAFRGNTVIEAKNLETGDTHTPAEFARDRRRGKKKGGSKKAHKKLSYQARQKLPSRSFALPGRKYPIEDIAHARNALARVSAYGTPSEKGRVRAAVNQRYPGLRKKTKVAITRGKTVVKEKKRRRQHAYSK